MWRSTSCREGIGCRPVSGCGKSADKIGSNESVIARACGLQAKCWRIRYKAVRSHSSQGSRPLIPELGKRKRTRVYRDWTKGLRYTTNPTGTTDQAVHSFGGFIDLQVTGDARIMDVFVDTYGISESITLSRCAAFLTATWRMKDSFPVTR